MHLSNIYIVSKNSMTQICKPELKLLMKKKALCYFFLQSHVVQNFPVAPHPDS